jgi:undecaprenyl-phosphate 4-deoxy-4-formamido-L-arabinose transferase
LRALSKKYDNVGVLNLSKNFGQHNAVMAGFNHAGGDYVLTMDDDLQHPVEEIPKLVEALDMGYDVVYGEYMVKKHSFLKNIGSEINNVMGNIIIKKPKDLRFTSFRIIRSYVVKEIVKYDAPYPYIDGLILRVTNNIGIIPVTHQLRASGQSNYTLKKLINLWLNGFLNFSITPLRLFTYLGMVMAVVGFLSSILILFNALIFNVQVPGWPSLIVSILIFSGVQLLSIGMVGEYIGRIFLTQNKTPQYVVKDRINATGPK